MLFRSRQELKSEKLLEYIGKELKLDLKTTYQKIGYKLLDKFSLLAISFNEISIHGSEVIKDLNFPQKEAEILVKIVQDKIKPIEVSVNATLILQSFSENGIEDIKAALNEGQKYAQKNEIKINIVYISAPKYRVEVTAEEYKEAEEELEAINKTISEEIKKRKGTIEIVRKK